MQMYVCHLQGCILQLLPLTVAMPRFVPVNHLFCTDENFVIEWASDDITVSLQAKQTKKTQVNNIFNESI